MKILFYISKAYSHSIISPIINELQNTGGNYRVLPVLGARENTGSLPQSVLLGTTTEAVEYDPDFVVVPGNFVDPRIPGIKVEIFHGLGVEKPSHYRIRHFFDVYCTSGPYVTTRYLKLQKKHGYFLVRETGWPKVDHILNYPGKGLRRKYGIDPENRVILYAPTFSRRMNSSGHLAAKLPGLIETKETWLVKFHELMDKKAITKFRNLDRDKIRIVDDHDITPYLHLADVMISDTSSVVYEFMILDKPVITYRTRKMKDKCVNISRISQLRPALDRCLREPGWRSDIRRNYLEQVNPYLDGRISQRLLEYLKTLFEEGFRPSGDKPVNWLRKRRVIRKYCHD